MSGISSNALKGVNYPENRMKYNGKELQSKEFQDGSGLELYDFSARNYDQQIGRWHSADPMADKYQDLTPYNYVASNPIKYLDPDGKIIRDKDGNIVITTTGEQINVPPMKISETRNQKGQITQRSSIDRVYEIVSMFADNGTPIQAMRLVSASQIDEVYDSKGYLVKATNSPIDNSQFDCAADCHGYTFAGNKLWVNDDQVNLILENDNVYECGLPESLADLVVFKKSNEVVHSGRKNRDGSYNNNAGILTTEYNVTLGQASRGLTDVTDKNNTEFVRRRNPDRILDTKLGSVDDNGMRTITKPEEIRKFLQQLSQ